MADDCVVTNTKGRVMNRRATLAEFKKDTDTYTSAKNMKMTVHMAAPMSRSRTGSGREIGKDKAGKPFDRTFLGLTRSSIEMANGCLLRRTRGFAGNK